MVFRSSFMRDKKITKQDAERLGAELIEWMLEDEKNVFFDRFVLIEKRLSKNTLSNLKKRYDSFSEYLDTAKEIQRIKLQEGGLFGGYNSRITQLMLSCHHGIKEESNNSTDSKDNKKSLHLHIKT